MTMLIIQTLLLMAIAYILGCIIGCLLHQWFGASPKAIKAAAPVAVAATGAAAMATAARARAPEPAPAPPPAPKPAEPVAAPPPPPPPPPPAPEPVKAVAAVPEAKKAPAKKRSAPRKRAAPKPRAKAAPKRKDDLKRIKGVGRQNEARLNAMGITTFDQIAAWTAKDQAEWGDRLAFPGRIEREDWVKQAKTLAKGGATEFSKRVAKGEVQSSVGKGTVGDLGKKPPVIKSARGGKGDNLTLIDGVGNAIEKKLFALGIHHFDQIAKWTKDHETWIGNEIGFPGRPERENWVAEAKILASGGTTEHAKRVEAGKIATSRKSKPGENK